MAGYRRFIAYVYEYRKGKKENNCGFIKVEVRNSICTIELHLHVEGLAAEEEARVFCFQRKEGLMNGIFIGNCMTQTDRVDCLLETDALNMGDSQTALGKMGGMVILTKSGGFFGTEWDDQEIRPENFKEMSVPAPVKEREDNTNSISQEPKPDTQSGQTPEAQATDVPSTTEDAPSTTEDIPSITEAVPSTAEEIHIQSLPSKPEKENPSLPFGQPFCPFADGDLSWCWQIHPQDLVHFPRKQCGLRNNRFLQYGYYNFGHLLLCRRPNGTYILGVPGSYDQQEQFMAGMFGFPSFKESSIIKVPKGKGGYWYRAIDPPKLTSS